MKLVGDSAKKILRPVTAFLYEFRYLVFITVVIGLFALVTFRIDQLSSVGRDESVYNEKSLTINKIEFNEEAIQRITELRNLDINFQPKYEPDRNDPFSD